MKTIFSTAGVRPCERFDSWHASARQYVVDHDSRPNCLLTFEAKLAIASLDDLTLVSFESSPMTVSHTSRHIAHTISDDLFICRQLAGKLLLEQEGREVTLRAGDMTMLDPRQPYRGQFLAGSNLLLVKVPRRRLETRVGRTKNMVAQNMRSEQGTIGMVSDFLSLVSSHAERLGPATTSVAEQVLDLLAMALLEAHGLSRPAMSTARFEVLTRVRSAIESRLSDPELDPATVAAAAGISVRYANAVLAQQSTSLARLIQRRRLERCRIALGEAAQAHRSISDIAYSWGFSDVTHFGRIFRVAYGLLPSEYRRAHNSTGLSRANGR
jgi:AraC family transcriptional regulator, positive regulator of tynA and feaB